MGASPNTTGVTFQDKATNTIIFKVQNTETKMETFHAFPLRPLYSPLSQKDTDGKVPTTIRLTPLNRGNPQTPGSIVMAVKQEREEVLIEQDNMDLDPELPKPVEQDDHHRNCTKCRLRVQRKTTTRAKPKGVINTDG